jgi:hypothetical protein
MSGGELRLRGDLLGQVQQRIGVPLVFSGQVTDRVLRLWEFLGAQTNTMHRLNVMLGTGLGGYVVAHRRTVVMSISFPVSTIVVLLLSPRGFYRLR